MLALSIMAANKISKEHYVMLADFRYALRQFVRFSENAAHAAGLTPQQHQAMLAIKGYPGREPINIGELAERLQILHHSAVGLVDRLVAQKHARRLRDATDRRQVRIALTARGEAALEKLSEAHWEQLSRIGPRIKEILESLHRSPES
jgi:DNA-binding MarR family transcriptional regulator